MPLVITRKEGQSFELRHAGIVATLRIKYSTPTRVVMEIDAPTEMEIVRDNAKHKKENHESDRLQ